RRVWLESAPVGGVPLGLECEGATGLPGYRAGKRGLLAVATLDGIRTTRVQQACRRAVVLPWHHTGDRLQSRLVDIVLGECSKQRLRVWMLRRLEDRRHRPRLDLLAGIHDHQAVRGLGEDRQI